MAKKEKIQYPNPEFFRCKDEINWKAQWENLKEVGAIAWDMLKATDWKKFGLDRVEDAKADGKRIRVSNKKQPITTAESTNIGQHNIAERYRLLTDKKVEISETADEYCVTIPLIK